MGHARPAHHIGVRRRGARRGGLSAQLVRQRMARSVARRLYRQLVRRFARRQPCALARYRTSQLWLFRRSQRRCDRNAADDQRDRDEPLHATRRRTDGGDRLFPAVDPHLHFGEDSRRIPPLLYGRRADRTAADADGDDHFDADHRRGRHQRHQFLRVRSVRACRVEHPRHAVHRPDVGDSTDAPPPVPPAFKDASAPVHRCRAGAATWSGNRVRRARGRSVRRRAPRQCRHKIWSPRSCRRSDSFRAWSC